MIDVSDRGALRRSGADFLIMHKYIMVLKIIKGGSKKAETFGSIPIFYSSVDVLSPRFKATFGPPVYEDAEIVCFPIKRVNP
jgi:hypothetical protein